MEPIALALLAAGVLGAGASLASLVILAKREFVISYRVWKLNRKLAQLDKVTR